VYTGFPRNSSVRLGVWTWRAGAFRRLQFARSVLFFDVPATTPGVWRVLLVDDDPLVSDSIRRMLEFDQRYVQTAGSAAEALAICDREKFDVVILDYLMPVTKGDALALALKGRYPTLPIIMITADAEKLYASASPPDAVDLLIGKPFQLAELREALVKVLAKR
jgi:two-component system cell cycle response regulator CpdR